jgi:hypothetical protein
MVVPLTLHRLKPTFVLSPYTTTNVEDPATPSRAMHTEASLALTLTGLPQTGTVGTVMSTAKTLVDVAVTNVAATTNVGVSATAQITPFDAIAEVTVAPNLIDVSRGVRIFALMVVSAHIATAVAAVTAAPLAAMHDMVVPATIALSTVINVPSVSTRNITYSPFHAAIAAPGAVMHMPMRTEEIVVVVLMNSSIFVNAPVVLVRLRLSTWTCVVNQYAIK